MTTPKWREWLLYILGALVLGAGGNAFWELVLRPAAFGLQQVMLTVITFGINKYKSQAYEDIARGFHEHSSSESLVWVVMLISFFYLEKLVPMWKQRLVSRDNIQPPTRATLILLTVAVTVFFGAVAARLVMLSYETKAIAHYTQLSRITAPYIAPHEVLRFDSRFAQIRTDKDYRQIIQELEAIARQQKQVVPAFGIW